MHCIPIAAHIPSKAKHCRCNTNRSCEASGKHGVAGLLIVQSSSDLFLGMTSKQWLKKIAYAADGVWQV